MTIDYLILMTTLYIILFLLTIHISISFCIKYNIVYSEERSLLVILFSAVIPGSIIALLNYII